MGASSRGNDMGGEEVEKEVKSTFRVEKAATGEHKSTGKGEGERDSTVIEAEKRKKGDRGKVA